MRHRGTERTEAVVEKLVPGGLGLVRAQGRAADAVGGGEVVLVPRVAAGERVAIAIDRSKRPARGKLLEVLEPSPARVEPRCAAFERCGGCDLMHLSAEGQRDARLAMLRESLGDVPIAWHAATPERGRTRARWHAKGLGDGRLVLGYHAPASNVIVDVAACPILDPRVEAALEDTRAILGGTRGSGEVHVALGREGKPVIAIAWNGDVAPSAFAESERRVGAGKLAGVEIAIAGASAPARVGDPRPVSTGSDGLLVIAPSRGFAQASEIGDRVLVDLVVARAAPEGKRVVELFAGSGNFTIDLARRAAHVTAVEIAKDAAEAARENLRARALGNAKVVTADADAYPIPKDAEVVVLDPPRAGARGAAKAIAERKPKRVVYVSCEPTTLARDLATLAAYRIESVDAVDLFPETSHVETVVTLVR